MDTFAVCKAFPPSSALVPPLCSFFSLSPTVRPVFSPLWRTFFLRRICIFHILNTSKARWRSRSKAGLWAEYVSTQRYANTRGKMFWFPSLNLFTFFFLHAAALSSVDVEHSPCCRLFDCEGRTLLANLPWRGLSILVFEHAAGSDFKDLGGKWWRVVVVVGVGVCRWMGGLQSPELYEELRSSPPILLFQDEGLKMSGDSLGDAGRKTEEMKGNPGAWRCFILWHVAGKHLWEDFFFFIILA